MALGGLWDLLVDGICRPPRDDQYEVEDLVGGVRGVFQVANSVGYREDLTVLNKRGLKLACSHYKPANVKGKDGKLPCVVYSHCNSGSRRDAEEAVFLLIPLGISVFTVDFAGSGVSEGDWVTLGASESEDLEAVMAYLRAAGGTSTIGLWGRSMGAVTALLYGHKDPQIAAMVLDSPFCRLTDLISEVAQQLKLPIPRYFLKRAVGAMRRSVQKRAGFDINQVSPLDTVHQCQIPALFGHGTEDSHIGIDHSRKLHNAYAGERNIIFFGGNHLTIRPEFFYITVAVFFHRQLGVQQLLEGAPPLELETLEQLASVVTALLENRVGDLDDATEGEPYAPSLTDQTPLSIRTDSMTQSAAATPPPPAAAAAAAAATAAALRSKRNAGEFERNLSMPRAPSPTLSQSTDLLAPSTPASSTSASRPGLQSTGSEAGSASVKQKPTHVMDMLRGRLNNTSPTPGAPAPTPAPAPTHSTKRPAPFAPMANPPASAAGAWSDSDSELSDFERQPFTAKAGTMPPLPPAQATSPKGPEEWKVQSRVRTAEGTVICEYIGDPPNRRYRWRVLGPDEELDQSALLGLPPPVAAPHAPKPPRPEPTAAVQQADDSSSVASREADDKDKAKKKKKGRKEPEWKLQNKVRTTEGILVCEYKGGFLNREYRWRLVPFEQEALDPTTAAPSTAASTAESSSPRSTEGGTSDSGIPPATYEPPQPAHQEYSMLRSQKGSATPRRARTPFTLDPDQAAYIPERSAVPKEYTPLPVAQTPPIRTPQTSDRQALDSSEDMSSQTSSPTHADEDRALLENVLEASGVGTSGEEGISEAALQLYYSLHPSTLLSLVHLHQAVAEQGKASGGEVDPASLSQLLLPTIKEAEDAHQDRDQAASGPQTGTAPPKSTAAPSQPTPTKPTPIPSPATATATPPATKPTPPTTATTTTTRATSLEAYHKSTTPTYTPTRPLAPSAPSAPPSRPAAAATVPRNSPAPPPAADTKIPSSATFTASKIPSPQPTPSKSVDEPYDSHRRQLSAAAAPGPAPGAIADPARRKAAAPSSEDLPSEPPGCRCVIQ